MEEAKDIKLTNRQIADIERIIRAKDALVLQEEVHIRAHAEAAMLIQDHERKWWRDVMGRDAKPEDTLYFYDKNTKCVRPRHR